MIVSSKSQHISPKATPLGRTAGHYGSAYTVGKRLVKYAGYAKKIEPYLPETYIDKYTYKPHKRVSGYLGQKFHAKENGSRYNKFGKTRREFNQQSHWNEYCSNHSKGGNCTF